MVQVKKMLDARPRGSTDLIRYPQCGHVPMDECPEQFNADVIAFVERLHSSSMNPGAVQASAPHEKLRGEVIGSASGQATDTKSAAKQGKRAASL
jgi:hypothetical protein